MSFAPSFPIGATVSNDIMRNEFKCGKMGGMRRSHRTNTLVIVSDHTKALYEDKWCGNELHYTGMGKTEHQDLTSQNRTLAESNTNGVEVHLFEVFKENQYIYHGKVRLCGAPYQETQNDINGNPRMVWMFPLKTVSRGIVVDSAPLRAYISNQEKRAKRLSAVDLEKRAKERSSAKVSNRDVTAKVYVRDPYVSEFAKQRANGICQLCEKPAPFCDKDGKPYLETHHIVWLAEGGADSIENTVALCPNCHRKMHVRNNANDVSILQLKTLPA